MNFRSVILAVCAAGLLAACSSETPAYWQGYVEADFLYLGSSGSGELSALNVKRGQQVAVGEILFAIDARLEQQELLRLQAQQEQQRALIANLQQGQRPEELAIVQAQLEQARSAQAQSQAQWLRVQAMQEKQLVSQEQVDLARANAKRDKERLQEMQARIKAAKLGARAREIDAAMAAEKALQAQIEQAQFRLQQKSVRAPQAGVIQDTLYQPGEIVGSGKPVLILLAEGTRKIRFFVPESAHGALQTGQAVAINCDGCEATQTAHIDFISNQVEYTPPVLFNRDNRSELVYRVEARPAADARLVVGQPLEVRAVSQP